MTTSATTAEAEVDHRYLARLQAQVVVGQGDLTTAVEIADRHLAQAQATAVALEDIEAEEAVLLEATRAVLDSETGTDAAALASAVFEHFLTETLGWTPGTPQQCLDLLASQRERVTALNAEAARLAKAAEDAAAVLSAYRARRDAVLHALTVGADPAMTIEAYRAVLAEVVRPVDDGAPTP